MKTLCTLFLLAYSFHLGAQVNAYARVDAISSTTLSISSPNEIYGTFTAGMQVIIMQMQDNVIGSNTSDNAAFGNLSTISSTGMYEVAVISSVVRSAGVATQIIINSPLAKTYNTGTHSSVQVISFPKLGTTSFTTTADINAVAWNGSVGGVVAFRVNGKLTLNHNIIADNSGFRGGAINGGDAGSCDYTTYRIADNELNALKGEGIYRVTNTSYAAGKGKILNGGGGGNSHNAGGGGGGNYTAGGLAGKGYNCTSSAGGLGGISLGTFVAADRVFMGGGAGAGEANNSYNTAGGNGGGIIIIKASEIETTGSGTALKISANGQTAANVGNDGAGGGGAGGSIVFEVPVWTIASTKTLVVSANGGTGGSVGDAAAHGGGGGGGQGSVFYSSTIPSANILTTTRIGMGGQNQAGGTYADNGAGIDNQGIFSATSSTLPVHLVYFKVSKNNPVELEWKAQNEITVSSYEVERSADGSSFNGIAERSPKNSGAREVYTAVDKQVYSSTVYYRLKITDKDENIEYGPIVAFSVKASKKLTISLTPNPVSTNAGLNIYSPQNAIAFIRILNINGNVVRTQTVNLHKGSNLISLHNLSRLSNGLYQVWVHANGDSGIARMSLQK